MEDPCKDCKIKKTLRKDKNGYPEYVECQTCPKQKEISKYVDECFEKICKIIGKDRLTPKTLEQRKNGKHKDGCNWCSVEGCTCGHIKDRNSWPEFIKKYGWWQALKVWLRRIKQLSDYNYGHWKK